MNEPPKNDPPQGVQKTNTGNGSVHVDEAIVLPDGNDVIEKCIHHKHDWNYGFELIDGMATNIEIRSYTKLETFASILIEESKIKHILSTTPMYKHLFCNSKCSKINKIIKRLKISSSRHSSLYGDLDSLSQNMANLSNKKENNKTSLNRFCFEKFLFDKDFNINGQYYVEFLVFDLYCFLFADNHSLNVVKIGYDKIKTILDQLIYYHKNIVLNPNKHGFIEIKKNYSYFSKIHLKVFQRCLQLHLKNSFRSDVFRRIFELFVELVKHESINIYGFNESSNTNLIYDCIINDFLQANLNLNLYSSPSHSATTIRIKTLKLTGWFAYYMEFVYQITQKYDIFYDILNSIPKLILKIVAILETKQAQLILNDKKPNKNRNKKNVNNNNQLQLQECKRWKRYIIALVLAILNQLFLLIEIWDYKKASKKKDLVAFRVELNRHICNSLYNANFDTKLVTVDQVTSIIYSNDSIHQRYRCHDHFFDALFQNLLKNNNNNNNNNAIDIKKTVWNIVVKYCKIKGIIKFEDYFCCLLQFIHCNCSSRNKDNIHINSKQLYNAINLFFNSNANMKCETCTDNYNYLIVLLRYNFYQVPHGDTQLRRHSHGWNWFTHHQVNSYPGPTPALIETILKSWIKNRKMNGYSSSYSYSNCLDNFQTLSSINKYWAPWDDKNKYNLKANSIPSFSSLSFGNSRAARLRCAQTLRCMTYLVANVWQDLHDKWLLTFLCKQKIFTKYQIPRYIVSMILDYKNSIVAIEKDEINMLTIENNHGCARDDGGDDGLLLFDTYGEAFDYYPKILTWSSIERDATISFCSNATNTIEPIWKRYFKRKTQFSQINNIASIENNNITNLIILRQFCEDDNCKYVLQLPSLFNSIELN